MTDILKPRIGALGLLLLFASCTSHLQEAKRYYTEGQRLDRLYRTESALAVYKKAWEKTVLQVGKNPSAQAFMLKGLTEWKLERWEEAEQSFLDAFSYGFEQGEEWARQLSLLGLAATLEEMELKDAALGIYRHLLNRSKLAGVSMGAAQRYTDLVLSQVMQAPAEQRERELRDLLRIAERLSEQDLACGYYHYLQAQILNHLGDFLTGFQQAAMARELGLPSAAVLRDNDNLIVFLHGELQGSLPPVEKDRFNAVYTGWIRKWGWQDAETPDWKRR